MFQVVVEERLNVIGDEYGILGSEPLAPELDPNRSSDPGRQDSGIMDLLTSVSLITA